MSSVNVHDFLFLGAPFRAFWGCLSLPDACGKTNFMQLDFIIDKMKVTKLLFFKNSVINCGKLV
ncbi:hypothetical protein B9G39_18605 [Zooshikella ganghwensis]|uniref:Uncharacterized protein n=1 Tax=Zooshikella ganghwensis TaxID=202772 RepID=A0A4P9VRN7_9GAMM|nr:hypothetical protein B9G39_18605 [Zooshikella ganghwensis]